MWRPQCFGAVFKVLPVSLIAAAPLTSTELCCYPSPRDASSTNKIEQICQGAFLQPCPSLKAWLDAYSLLLSSALRSASRFSSNFIQSSSTFHLPTTHTEQTRFSRSVTPHLTSQLRRQQQAFMRTHLFIFASSLGLHLSPATPVYGTHPT